MKEFLFVLLALLWSVAGFPQKKVLNIPAIHQLVDQSKAENKLQVKARDKQAVVTANERANLSLLEKLKVRYRELQQRYNTLGLLINTADIGLNARPMVSRIIANEELIITLVRRNPALLAIGFDSELLFASRASGLLSYVTGLVLSLGDVNQMRASDRKMLFEYVLTELSSLQEQSGNLLSLLAYADMAGVINYANPFRDYIDRDISIGRDIIQNAKFLK